MVLNVGAASSREFNCRGWKPLPQKAYLIATWTFQISRLYLFIKYLKSITKTQKPV